METYINQDVDCNEYYGWITFDYYIEFDPYCKRHIFMETNQFHGETYKYEMKIDTVAYTWTFKDTLNNNILIDTAAKQIKLENSSVNYLDLKDNEVELLANTSITIIVGESVIKLEDKKITVTTPRVEIIADDVDETIGIRHLITGFTEHVGDVKINGKLELIADNVEEDTDIPHLITGDVKMHGRLELIDDDVYDEDILIAPPHLITGDVKMHGRLEIINDINYDENSVTYDENNNPILPPHEITGDVRIHGRLELDGTDIYSMSSGIGDLTTRLTAMESVDTADIIARLTALEDRVTTLEEP